MDSKSLKNALKTAAGHIKEKQFKEAVKICQTILEASPQNYRALVFLGKAAEGLNQYDHSLKAYRQAIDACPDDLLAWQGLNKLYERQPPVQTKEHTEVLEKLLQLSDSDEQKKLDAVYNLALHLTCSYNYEEQILERIRVLAQQITDEQKKYVVGVGAVRLCYKATNPEAKDAAFRMLGDLYPRSTFASEEKDQWEFYAKHLYLTCDDLNLVIERTGMLVKNYPVSALLSVNLAEIVCHLRQCNMSEYLVSESVDTQMLPSPLKELYSYYSGVGSFLEDIPQEKLKMSSQLFSIITSLTLCLQSRSYKKASELLKKADGQLSGLPPCLRQCSERYTDVLNTLRLKLACKQRNYSQVISIWDESKQPQFRQEYIVSLIESDKLDDALKMLNCEDMADKTLLGYLKLKQSLYPEVYSILCDVVKATPKSVNANLWLGESCYHIGGKDKETAKYLLTAAKLDPENEIAFLYLGLHYTRAGDMERGMKCLKKSYALNPTHDEICIAYIDQLMSSGLNDQALDILIQTTQLSPTGGCKWAWFRLGILRSNEGNLTDAINCIQQALRADQNDSNCWECLADCYVKRGSFVAAIGAYEKACEINEDSVYSRYQIALTKHKLGLYTEARDQYLQILVCNQDYTPVLKGLGDVHISLALEALKQYVYGGVASNIENALKYLSRAALLRRDLSCVWKSLGDILTLCYALPADSIIECPEALNSSDPAKVQKDSMVKVTQSQALFIGSRCYVMCERIKPENSFTWHDLSVNCLYQARLCTDESERRKLLENAAHCSRKAISLSSSAVSHFNCLGVIYMEKDIFDAAAAQNYLIKSVELDPSNVQGWTNLASLYLMEGDIDLAHEALKVAQSADPKYNECWTGQAIVAETIAHDEAMDLFRHTTELGNNSESLIGYAQWVITTLLDEKKVNSDHYRYAVGRLQAIPVACDGLGHVIDKKPTPQSLNVYGLLLERQGLLRMAVSSLRRCVELAEKSTQETVNISVYRANYARVLCSSGDGEELKLCLEQIRKLTDPTVQDKAVTALAYYKLAKLSESGQYEECGGSAELYQSSFSGYNELLECTENTEARSHVYAAMGMLAVKCGDNDTAKTAFFQCSQSDSPSIYGLAGLCSLGLLSGDGELAVAALNELIKCGDSKDAIKLKAIFSSCMSALEGDMRSARNHLLNAIHCYPLDSDLHDKLIALSIHSLPTDRECVLRLSQSLTAVQDLVGVASLAEGDISKALKCAQNAVHLYPDRISNWMLLLNSAYSADKTSTGRVASDTVRLINDCIMTHAEELQPDQMRWLAELLLYHAAENDPASLSDTQQKFAACLEGSTVAQNLIAFTNNSTIPDTSELSALLLQAKLLSHDASQYTTFLRSSGEKSSAARLMLANDLIKLSINQQSDEYKTEFFSSLEGLDTASAKFLLALYHWYISNNKRLAVKHFSSVILSDGHKETYQKQMASKFISEYELERKQKEDDQ